MLYVWGKVNADRFLGEITQKISEIGRDLLRDDSVFQYYVEYIKPNSTMSKDQWVEVEIKSLIEDLKDRVKCCKDYLASQKKSANEVYENSYFNEYESIRGKSLKGGQKKIFLRRLLRDGEALSDKSANRKVQQSTNSMLSDTQRPYLRTRVWSPIINDAFVGGAIDSQSRFDIRSLPYDLWVELENLTSSDILYVERAATFLQKICIKYPELYNKNRTYT